MNKTDSFDTFISVHSDEHKKIINLKNVSNIKYSFNENRVIFNFNYSLKQTYNENKHKTDFMYYDFDSPEEFDKYVVDLERNQYLIDNFIVYSYGLVNANSIVSVKFEDKNNRTIFNLDHAVDFKGKSQAYSAFVFADFDYEDKNGYETFKQNLKQKLGV